MRCSFFQRTAPLESRYRIANRARIADVELCDACDGFFRLHFLRGCDCVVYSKDREPIRAFDRHTCDLQPPR